MIVCASRLLMDALIFEFNGRMKLYDHRAAHPLPSAMTAKSLLRHHRQ